MDILESLGIGANYYYSCTFSVDAAHFGNGTTLFLVLISCGEA